MRRNLFRDGKLVATEWTVSLDEHKQERIDEIDARSRELISQGLEVAPGVRISLSIPAQTNLQGIAIKRLLGEPYVPQPVSRLDGRTHTITDESELFRLARLMGARIKAVYEVGQDLRAAVLDAPTHEAVDAIKDTRR